MRRKFIIGPSYRVARDWAWENHLDTKDYVIVTEMNRLRGIDGNQMEFVLLDGHWLNGVFQENDSYYFYKHLLSRGAIETRVYNAGVVHR